MCIQELELAPYLLHCERRLGEEYERCEAYLGHAMRKPLKDIVDRCLLEAHLSTILEGSRQLLAGCQEEDLARLYTCAICSLRCHCARPLKRLQPCPAWVWRRACPNAPFPQGGLLLNTMQDVLENRSAAGSAPGLPRLYQECRVGRRDGRTQGQS